MTADKQLPTYKDKQRKYRLALLSLAVLCLGLVIIAISPTLVPAYSTFSTAVIGLNLAYGSANVCNKWVTGRSPSE